MLVGELGGAEVKMEKVKPRSWSWKRVLAIGAVLSLPVVGANVGWAQDRDEASQSSIDKYRLFCVDDEGNRHEATFEILRFMPGGYLGVLTDETRDGGAFVERVLENSPAKQAGLREKDVIVGLEGETISRTWDLIHGVMAHQPGEQVEIEFLRDGRRESVRVELSDRDLGVSERADKRLRAHLDSHDMKVSCSLIRQMDAL